MMTAIEARQRTNYTRELFIEKAMLEAEIAVKKSVNFCSVETSFYVDLHVKNEIEERLFQMGYTIIPTNTNNTIHISWGKTED